MKENELQKLENFVIFQTDEGKVNIDVFFAEETLWLTQKLMSELFDVSKSTLSEHFKNIFLENELDRDSTVRKFRTVQIEGEREVERELEYYSLDAIIAVGYRVNSYRATKFRIWATKILKEIVIKGFVLDDDRLKQGKHFGQDYFDELVSRIREIRASERRFYQKVTDLYMLSADYDSTSQETKDFFAQVQNKLHWAITGKTAAEIIYSEADAQKQAMGLQTWDGAPDTKITKRQVSIAKNYLSEEHIKELERLVGAYLDLAENRAARGIVMNMKDWIEFLDRFLELSDYPILTHKGKISKETAKLKAEGEFEKFRVRQDLEYESDFDREVKKVLEKTRGNS